MREISSVVQITSRPIGSSDTYISLFVKGERKPVEKAIKARGVSGTSVIVKDFYYTLPVRQKCMSPAIELKDTVQSLKAIALAVSFP